MTDANAATVSTSAPEGEELEDEHAYRERELVELEALVHPDVKQDVGCSVSGLYELVGRCRWSYNSNAADYRIAIITHKGAAADAGHYIGFVKKRAFRDILLERILSEDPRSIAQKTYEDENDEDWYKFDDDKVSIFPAEKLSTLDGGGTSCQIVDMRHLNPLFRTGFIGICTIV